MGVLARGLAPASYTTTRSTTFDAGLYAALWSGFAQVSRPGRNEQRHNILIDRNTGLE